MSLKAHSLFKSIIIILCIFNTISIAFGSNCRIKLSANLSQRPKLLHKIGAHKIDLAPQERDRDIFLFNNQEIEANCYTKFQDPEYHNTQNKLDIKCYNGYLLVNSESSNYGLTELFLDCSPKKWNLYEISHNFVWCPNNVTSYLLARPMETEISLYQYQAGICHDTSKLSIKSLYYTISPKHSEHKYPTVLSQFYRPDNEIKYLKEIFTSKSVIASDYDNQAIQDWIQFVQYNYSSIVQNALMRNDFSNELGSLLDFAWWRNLRLGNWKQYETALTSHVESQQQSYNILSGISADATAPIIESCKANYTLKALIDNRKQTIPMYVWNYLRSTVNSSDEIVIIGFNSPFYEFYAEKDVVFCKDKCHEISWLQKVRTTFRYSVLGVVFCCSVEDVKSSNRLEGFPINDMDTKPEENFEPTTLISSLDYRDFSNYD